MEITLWLVLIGMVFLVGFTAGARFEERNLELRERRLARRRREAREGREVGGDLDTDTPRGYRAGKPTRVGPRS